MANADMAVGFIFVMEWALVAFIAIIGMSLGIPALVIGVRNQGAECAKISSSIDLTYSTWLIVFGAIIIGFAILMAVAAFIHYCSHGRGDNPETGFFFIVYSSISFAIFNLSWYIIGSILLFQTIVPWCQGNSMYGLGIAIFIVEIIIYAVLAVAGYCYCRKE